MDTSHHTILNIVKMITPLNDTIAAISTPRGEGAIGLVRLSGPHAFSIADQLFCSDRTSGSLFRRSHHLHYGTIKDPETNEAIDEVLLTVLKSPRTYTCQNMVEINCHGGPVALERVLLLALRAGARLAEPGEFTKRAFLNGRIDLAQAEAVADIIQARTDLSRMAAMDQLAGKLSEAVEAVRDSVLQILVEIEAAIDFPDEDLDFEDSAQLAESLQTAETELDQLLQTAQDGRILRDGVRVAIIGRTNVGKSSLLNVLLKEERAIVTDTPGTTRDTIEESLNLRGLALRLVDTAGLREAADSVEVLGIQRSKKALESADLLLLVLDTSQPLTEDDMRLIAQTEDRSVILVANKTDLPSAWEPSSLAQPVISTSMIEGLGIDELKEGIWNRVVQGETLIPESAIVTNVRHQDALEKARNALQDAFRSLQTNMPYELVALDLRIALDQLGLVVGKTTTDDILDRIFSQFCVGK